MAVFTAIATAIVGAIGVTGIAATIATSIISAGLALGTAKALGVFEPPKQQETKDPGVKIQLPPSTDNRIPVFYGKNYTGGIIVDAGIKNQNNTMQYVMVISEKTDSGTYSVDKIFRDDAEITFTGNSAVSQIDTNGTSANNINGKFRVNIYAGNAQSSVNQIFPITGKVAAQSLVPTITASTNYEDLVYAVVEIDYDPENGLTGLGAITYRITNSLSEPSNVLLDYLRNDRYGAGLSNTDLVLSTFDDLYDHANINGSTGNVEYLTSANVSAYHSRYQIDGMLSTYVPVKQNINEICKSCSTFFTFNSKQGKFQVVPNRAATTAEKANAFVLNDDNITSSLEITSTELYSLFNSVDCEYPSYEQKDQTKTLVIETPSGDRNTNEPDNPLDARFNLVNDAPRVHNLANIDLRQSRLSTVVSMTADYSAIQIDVGDIVKLTSDLYGFSDKLFRVMRVTEIETAEAMLGVKLVLLEYSDDVYTHNVVKSDSAVNFSGIPGWNIGWGNANIDWPNIIGNINIITGPTANANVVDAGNGNVVANVDLGNIDLNLPDFSLGGFTPGFNFNIDYANIVNQSNIMGGADQVIVSVQNDDLPNNQPTTHIIEPEAGTSIFDPDGLINVNVPLFDLGIDYTNGQAAPLGFPAISNAAPTANANLGVQLRNQQTGTATPVYQVPNFNFEPEGAMFFNDIRDIGSGFQVEDTPASNTTMANSDLVSAPLGDANTLISVPDAYDLGGIEPGDYFFDTAMQFGGEIPTGGANLAFQSRATKLYQEKHSGNLANVVGNTVVVTDTLEGVIKQGVTDIGGLAVSSKGKVDIDPAEGLAGATSLGWNTTDKVYVPAQLYIYNYANTNLSNSSLDRSAFGRTNNGGRTFKGDRYINIL